MSCACAQMQALAAIKLQIVFFTSISFNVSPKQEVALQGGIALRALLLHRSTATPDVESTAAEVRADRPWLVCLLPARMKRPRSVPRAIHAPTGRLASDVARRAMRADIR